MSLAYSGSMVAAGPLPVVARCHTPTNSPNSSSETSAARHVIPILRRPAKRFSNALDGEALEVIVGLRRIELLAHDLEAFRTGCRRCEPDLLHELGGVGGEIDLLGHRLVVDVALDLSPALHLGEDPDRERLPREGVEIDKGGGAPPLLPPTRAGGALG